MFKIQDSWDKLYEKLKELKNLGYEELAIPTGENLDTVIDKFFDAPKQFWYKAAKHRKGDVKYFMNFNGNIILSDDNVTKDDVYKFIIGMTKEDREQRDKEELEQYQKEKAEYEKRIPLLTKQYILKGHEIINKEYWEHWEEIVPIRLSDIYRGMELDASLQLIKMFNNHEAFENIKNIFDSQGHSGMSYSLVKCMLKEFGAAEFVDWLN